MLDNSETTKHRFLSTIFSFIFIVIIYRRWYQIKSWYDNSEVIALTIIHKVVWNQYLINIAIPREIQLNIHARA